MSLFARRGIRICFLTDPYSVQPGPRSPASLIEHGIYGVGLIPIARVQMPQR